MRLNTDKPPPGCCRRRRAGRAQDACFDEIDLSDKVMLEVMTFFATRASASVAPAGDNAAHNKRVLSACCPRLLRLAADSPSKWPASLPMADLEELLATEVATALHRLCAVFDPVVLRAALAKVEAAAAAR